jgi:branched-chain amino acid transport system substrate-binding protein
VVKKLSNQIKKEGTTMEKKKLYLLLICGMCVVVGVLISPSHCRSEVTNEIRIGATSPLSGPAAENGVSLKQGMILATEEWNLKGGIYIKEYGKKLPIKLFVEDCQSKPEIGVIVGEKLITKDKVHMILGDALHSSVTLALMELVPKYGIPIVSVNAASDEIEKKIVNNPSRYWSFWKGNWSGVAANSEPIVFAYKYITEKGVFKPKNKTVSIIKEDTDWGRSVGEGIEKRFYEIGWKTIINDTVPIGNTDFYPNLAKLKASNPDVVASIFTSLASGVALAKQSGEVNVKFTHTAAYYPVRPEYIPQAGIASEYLIWTPLLLAPDFIPRQKEFVSKIEKRWKVTPSSDHMEAYDAVYNCLDSIARAGSLNPKDIVEALSKLDRKGVWGRYVFDQKYHHFLAGENFLPCIVAQIQSGKNVIIWPPSIASHIYRNPPWFE